MDLVETWTADGMRLHGAYEEASRQSQNNIDAVILFSGVGSNFYSSSLMTKIGVACREVGADSLSVNTRGHDTVNTMKTRSGGCLQGAAFEIVDDCRHDVDAWINFLAERGKRRIALIGHSLGALKVLYSQTIQPNRAVTSVIAVSPPRLNYELFLTGAKAADFEHSYREASQLAESGNAQMMFQALFPFPMMRSAANFLDKYGPDSRYDLLKYVTAVKTHLMFSFGALEVSTGGVAFAGLDQQIAELDWPQQPEIIAVEGADHFYSGCAEKLTAEIAKFIVGEGS